MGIRDQLRQGDSRELIDGFAAVVDELYADQRGHPAAPTGARSRALLADDHPTRARCEVHLALIDGPAGKGRIAAIVDPRQVDAGGAPLGILGMFACDRNPDVARWLFDAGMTWLAKRGCGQAVGPIELTRWHGWGLKLRGGDWLPGEPLHPEHYPDLWQAAGFEPTVEATSYRLTDLARVGEELGSGERRARDLGYRTRSLAAGEESVLRELILAANPAALAISVDEYRAARALDPAQPLLATELAVTHDDQPVGFVQYAEGSERAVVADLAVASDDPVRELLLAPIARRAAGASGLLIVARVAPEAAGDDRCADYALCRQSL